jgi:hypothetical protein
MKVGVLGSGVVGRVLAAGFLKHGHDVTVGKRSPGQLAAWRAEHPQARVASFADAAKTPGLLRNEWRHAFKLLTRSDR